MSLTYTFSTEQEERLRALLARNGRVASTPNEKAHQIVERGLGALELQYKQREKQKELMELGRAVQRDPNYKRPQPMATIAEHKRR